MLGWVNDDQICDWPQQVTPFVCDPIDLREAFQQAFWNEIIQPVRGGGIDEAW